MTFKPVAPMMQGLVSEAHPDFDKLASPEQLAAAKRAESQARVAERDADWERTASPEEREERRKQSLQREKKGDVAYERQLGGEIRARYKIEVMFEKGRTTKGPNLCGIQLWESGKKFHGGGDQLMYWCMDTSSNDGCKAPFSGECIAGPYAVCPSCSKTIQIAKAANMRVLRVSTLKLAEELVRIFHSLGGDADIYLKYHKTDVHYLAMIRAKGPEVAHRLKGMAIYPLKNILKDTSSGSDLAGRFFAFLAS